MKVHSKGEKVTYAKAPPIEVAPASPILFDERPNTCNVLFWLQIRHKHTLITPLINQKIRVGCGMGKNVHKQLQHVTYARPAPMPEAPRKPMSFRERTKIVRDVFWLPIKPDHALIMQSEILGWRESGIPKRLTDSGSTSVAD